MIKATMRLIFTDLDGSLLDHHSYSFAPAESLLIELESLGVPVIPITSKTAAELLTLREQLCNRHPFIVENGAAIYIPRDYFARQPDNSVLENNFWVLRNAPRRNHWQQLLAAIADDFKAEFNSFDSIYRTSGAAGIAALTGLEPQAAELANQREHSEPVHWLGSAERRLVFIDRLQKAGATVLQGGRFLNIGGTTDKGVAMLQLRDLYLRDADQSHCATLAIGDSNNDLAMLEQASSALIIKSDHHSFPTLTRSDNCYFSDQLGPYGWVEGVSQWLQQTLGINIKSDQKES